MNKSQTIVFAILFNFISSNALLSCFGPADRFYGPNARTENKILHSVMVMGALSTGVGKTTTTGSAIHCSTVTTTGAMKVSAVTTTSAKANTIATIIAKTSSATKITSAAALTALKNSAIHNATGLITGKAGIIAATVTGCTIS